MQQAFSVHHYQNLLFRTERYPKHMHAKKVISSPWRNVRISTSEYIQAMTQNSVYFDYCWPTNCIRYFGCYIVDEWVL